MDTGSIDLLRQNALQLFQAGINAADPYFAVKNSLEITDNKLKITLGFLGNKEKRIVCWPKIHLIAFGKAACHMTEAAIEIIPQGYLASKPIVVTNYENVTVLKDCEVIGAGHPLPDLAGQKSAEAIAEKLKKTKENEVVLVLVSGGGSALIPFPVRGITLDDKIATTDLLLASGANINQINCVRKHLSQIKGGQLARQALPAELHGLILSDVLGDDLSAIASGPTVPDNTSFSDAILILKKKNIWDDIPQNVKQFLEEGEQGCRRETPKQNDVCFKKTNYTLVGSNTISLNVLIEIAKKNGFEVDVFSRQLCGEAREIAEQLVLYTKNRIGDGLLHPIAILAGGETTVTLKGTGQGGRSQEMALAFSIVAKQYDLKGKWMFLSGGTDGRDGPTDAAGGIVDSGTYSRMMVAGINPENSLKDNDSYTALKEAQGLVMTGATGTNVADLQILLIQPE
ncbi:MAG: glycerate kinase [Methylococcales bacterium]|nr:glycerate kinase [Methylococcales bacterium]